MSATPNPGAEEARDYSPSLNLQRLLRERLETLLEQWHRNRAERERLDAEGQQLSEDIAALRGVSAVEARLTGSPTKEMP